jgi:hypothetical protein
MTKKMQTLTEKRQTLPLVREGPPQRHNSNRQQQQTSGHENQKGLDINTYWLTVSRNVTLTLHFLHPTKFRTSSSIVSSFLHLNILSGDLLKVLPRQSSVRTRICGPLHDSCMAATAQLS